MSTPHDDERRRFFDAVHGLLRGDFSLLAPLFEEHRPDRQLSCPILAWYRKGWFAEHHAALCEALTCACFLGCTPIAAFLLGEGVDPAAGIGTGLNAFHWAANRAQLETVRLLIEKRAPLEIKNMYGGTVLSCTVWSAIHESKPNHLCIIEALIIAGARLDAVQYPTGQERVDEVLRRHRAV